MALPDRERPGPLLRARLIVATGAGTGYVPIAPGTAGSLPGLVLYWALFQAGGTTAVLVAIPLLFALGVWCADAAESHFGRTDPGHVVIDEVVGQMVTLLFLPPTIGHLIGGFFVFRILDVIKPFPARRLERLHGGSGIMLDDVVAGIYGNLLLLLLHWIGTRG